MNVFQDLAERFLSLLTLLAALIHYVGKLEELLLRQKLDVHHVDKCAAILKLLSRIVN